MKNLLLLVLFSLALVSCGGSDSDSKDSKTSSLNLTKGEYEFRRTPVRFSMSRTFDYSSRDMTLTFGCDRDYGYNDTAKIVFLRTIQKHAEKRWGKKIKLKFYENESWDVSAVNVEAETLWSMCEEALMAIERGARGRTGCRGNVLVQRDL